jgi:aspartate aminotransferase
MSLEISKRGQSMPASPIRKLTPLADEAKRRGVKVYHLNIGQPDIETPLAMRRRLEAVPDVLAYSPSAGTHEFVEALVGYYRSLGLEATADQVIATTGRLRGHPVRAPGLRRRRRRGGAARAVLHELLVLRRDRRAQPPPRHHPWGRRLPPSGPRRIRKGALRAHPRGDPVQPEQPHGTVVPADEVQMVAEVCRDRGLFLIVDEVYRELVYDGRKPASALSLRGFERNVVVVDSLSKRYSACGIRPG